jgi:hypothetical protein
MPPRPQRTRNEGISDAQGAENALPPEENYPGSRGTQEQEEETTAQRLERRRAELLEKRRLKQIQEIEEELAGGSRASSMALTGIESTPVSQKRPASTDLSYSASVKRALAPSVFKGKSLRELRDFVLGCGVYFDAHEEYEERRRIKIAASYLREEALYQWSRLKEKPTTWVNFKQVLRNMIQDPANRMSTATLKRKRAY